MASLVKRRDISRANDCANNPKLADIFMLKVVAQLRFPEDIIFSLVATDGWMDGWMDLWTERIVFRLADHALPPLVKLNKTIRRTVLTIRAKIIGEL